MIKRNILVAIIPALLMINLANSAEIYNKSGNKLDLYGKVVGEHNFTTSGKHRSTDSSYNKIGFKGETQIGEHIVGYGQWEYHVKAGMAEGNQENVTRLAFAGIKINDAGWSLDYGRNYGIMYDVESYTDMAPSFSGETWGGSHTDSYMSSYSTGLLTYRSKNLFGLVNGLKLGVQYQGKNERNNLKQANGDGIGISLGYEFDEGFDFIGAYSSANRTVDQKADGKGNRTEYWAVGAKYDLNNIYLASVYAETRNASILGSSGGVLVSDSVNKLYNVANKTKNFEMIAQYKFDFGLRPSISYVQSKGKGIGNDKENRDLAKYITTGATYFFNNNFNLYGDYRLNLLNHDDKESTSINWVGSDNQAVIGVAYQF